MVRGLRYAAAFVIVAGLVAGGTVIRGGRVRAQTPAAAAPATAAPAAAAPDAAALYNGKCASCHEIPSAGSRAPNRAALQQRAPEIVVDALTGGSMRYQGLSLSGVERRALAEYLTGKKMGGDLTGAAKAMCRNPAPMAIPS
jgi:mono/diheme cytochrome c family protein